MSVPVSLPHASMAPTSDAASLRTALSMMDDWASEFCALFELGETPAAAHSRRRSTELIVAPYRPRRDARKLELLELRAQVDDLQRVVDAVKNKASPTENGSEFTSEAALAVEKEWVSIAKGQENARYAAEVNNAKLRTLARSQLKDAHKIVRLTQRIAALEQAVPVSPPTSFEYYRGPRLVPESQLKRIRLLDDQTREVFACGAFVKKKDTESYREVYFRNCNDEAQGIEIEFQMAWFLPFGVDDVANALWAQATRMTSREKTFEYMDLLESDDTLVTQFIATPIDKEAFGINHGQMAGQRMPKNLQDDSVLILSTIDARGFDNQMKLKGCAIGDGWLLADRVKSHQPTARFASPLTRIRWCRRVRVTPPEYECMSSTERSLWVHSVITGPMRGNVERNLDWHVQAIENLLLHPRTIHKKD